MPVPAGSRLAISSSLCPVIAVNRSLTSCATPVASWLLASIFRRSSTLSPYFFSLASSAARAARARSVATYAAAIARAVTAPSRAIAMDTVTTDSRLAGADRRQVDRLRHRRYGRRRNSIRDAEAIPSRPLRLIQRVVCPLDQRRGPKFFGPG